MKHPKVRWVMQAADALSAAFHALQTPARALDEIDPKLLVAIQADLAKDLRPQLEDAKKELNKAEMRVNDLKRLVEAQGEVIKKLAEVIDEWRRVL